MQDQQDKEKICLSLTSTRFLGSLKRQQYSGGSEADGVKKPLNAFLGELFIGSFKDEDGQGETKMITEQVRYADISYHHLHGSRHPFVDRPAQQLDNLLAIPTTITSRR